MFGFSASLNDFAPLSPMMMSIDFIGTEKSIWSINAIFVLFLFSQPKLSSVSVVFNFNASLNDVTPLPPKQLPVYLIRMGEWIVDGCHFCVVFFFVHHSDQVLLLLCLISVHHSKMLLLCFQCCCLLI